MDAKMETAAGDIHNFEPASDLIQEEDCNTLLLYLPGFTIKQLRVQLTRTRLLKISGSRPIGDDKWSSFQKDFPVPENCDTNKITAKFQDGILYVRQPKLIVPAEREDKKVVPTPAPEETAAAPPASKARPELETSTTKTAAGEDDRVNQARVKDLPQKPVEKKEEKPTGEDGESRKDERRHTTEKTGGAIDGGKRAAEERSHGDEREKVSGTSSVDAAAKLVDYNKANAAAVLKMAREKMVNILVFIFAFAIGLYISNWFSRKAKN